MSEKKFWQYLSQIMDGLEIIHQKGMTHSDLTLHNIGIKGETLKLMDFGLTSYISGFDEKRINTGSIDTRATELFEGKRATTQSDMWSLGCIMYKLLTGEDLFFPNIKKPQEPSVERDNYEMEVYKLINSKNINEELKNLKSSDQIKNILKKCLERNPSKRVKNASELRVMLDAK